MTVYTASNGAIVADLTTLRAIPSTDLPASGFVVLFVASENSWFEYNPTLTSGDATPINNPTNGRWLRIGRDKLTANRTYYVRTDGSDSNTGLANTSGGAFLTIKKAVDTVASLDMSIYDITIQLGDGTYTEGFESQPLTGAGKLTIQGNTTTPSNTVWTSTSSRTFWLKHQNYILKNFKLQGGTVFSLQVANTLDIDGMHFGSNTVAGVIAVAANGYLLADVGSGAITITGNSPRFFYFFLGGKSYIGNITINLSGSVNFSTEFLLAESGANIWFSGTVFTGTATGVRYKIFENAVIKTEGAGANYLPGNSAGTITSGGQYT